MRDPCHGHVFTQLEQNNILEEKFNMVFSRARLLFLQYDGSFRTGFARAGLSLGRFFLAGASVGAGIYSGGKFRKCEIF